MRFELTNYFLLFYYWLIISHIYFLNLYFFIAPSKVNLLNINSIYLYSQLFSLVLLFIPNIFELTFISFNI